MAEGNGNGAATQNKQVIGWAVTALGVVGMMLFQWAILGGISDLRSDVNTLHQNTDSIAADVSSLKTGVSDIRQDVAEDRGKEQVDIDKLWSAEQRRDDALERRDEQGDRGHGGPRH